MTWKFSPFIFNYLEYYYNIKRHRKANKKFGCIIKMVDEVLDKRGKKKISLLIEQKTKK